MSSRLQICILMRGVPPLSLLISGLISTLLGLVVLIGWYLHITTLIQVLPSFVPMQYNTALGFFVSGLALVLINRGARTAAVFLGGLVSSIGLLTLIEYVFGFDLRIDQLLMEHYVNVKTSHPGRMAPNTALCFLLSGLAAMVICRNVREVLRLKVAGILGAATLGLGAVALFGYLSGLETTYGWGHLTRMAVHTSCGFVTIGIGVVVFTVRKLRVVEGTFSNWLTWPVAIGTATGVIVLWQAVTAQSTPDSRVPVLVLMVGMIQSALVTLLAYYVLNISRKQRELVLTSDERDRAQAELLLMSKVFMDAADPIIIEDLNGHVLDLNREAIGAYGWAEEAIIGKSILTIVPPDRHEQAQDLLRRCLDGEEVRNIEGLRQDRHKQIIPVLLTLSLLRDDDGTPVGVATIAKDLTLQKEAEMELKRMSKVFMDAADPIIIEDTYGYVSEMNEEAVRAYGYSRDDLLGRSIRMIVPEVLHDHANTLLKQCLSGEEVRNVEGLRKTKDGKIFPILLTLSLLRDEAGKPLAVASIAKDISDQKRAEEALKQQQDMLEQRVSERTQELESEIAERQRADMGSMFDLDGIGEKLTHYDALVEMVSGQ